MPFDTSASAIQNLSSIHQTNEPTNTNAHGVNEPRYSRLVDAQIHGA